jgi:hypothetical protein
MMVGGMPVAHFAGDYGRLRAVVRAPDGSLWCTTSNRDGRGNAGPGDDKILVIPLRLSSGRQRLTGASRATSSARRSIESPTASSILD